MSASQLFSDRDLYQSAAQVGRRARGAGWCIVPAESCTGCWIARALTDVPGSSQRLDSGYVTYSNTAKMRAVGVAEWTPAEHGAGCVLRHFPRDRDPMRRRSVDGHASRLLLRLLRDRRD